MIESVLSDCVKIKTPAKINLGLYITDKRPDGYHELCSIFLPVELYDVIDLKIDPVSDTLKINTSGPFAADCPTDESNIVFKVYNKITSLLKEEKIKRRVKTESGLDLHIEKNIPAQAGLGGGSSNAAGFLKALNLLWGLNMSNYELKTLVSEIGADVPFFIECKPALVKGIGDIIEPFELKKNYWVIIVKPKTGLSTAQVYNRFTLSLTLKKTNAKHLELLESLAFHGLKHVEELRNLSNDLEGVSSATLPDIVAIRDYLEKMSPDACMMSGSGSAVFALFKEEPHHELRSLNPSWFLCTTKVMRGQYANYRDQSLPGK